MTEPPALPNEPSLAEMLHQITTNIDVDLSIIIADTLNTYISAIQRTGRVTILPNDTVRILHIINQLQEACAAAPDKEIIPGTPKRNGR